jgi:ribonuclease HII
VIAAVSLTYKHPLDKLDDSKKLSAKSREQLYEQVMEDAASYKIIEIGKDFIDKHNILEATMEGMRQSSSALFKKGSCVLIDGNLVPKGVEAKAIVKGDSLHACIAAASILAKVHRDRLMMLPPDCILSNGFDRNKGYGTAETSPSH